RPGEQPRTEPSAGHPTVAIADTTPEKCDAPPTLTPPSGAGAEPVTESAPAKRTPAEAFSQLADAVNAMRAEISELRQFVRTCDERLVRDVDQHRAEGMTAVLHSLMRLHGQVYRHVSAIESGNVEPNPFISHLFESIEGELAEHGVQVIRPQPGDELNFELMTTIGSIPCAFWRKPDRVAQVASCGFVLQVGLARRILKKAEVTVYRR
ncbi:MAG: nucleotide exchange factor GrpE, partial [Nitrospira sp.]|nr:nucleotide exchange factor GrpE [Nitrospira sp.]